MIESAVGATSDFATAGASGGGRADAATSFDRPHAHGQPARLAAVAHLFGLDAPSPDAARVLEIGSAGGGDIIPLAAQHPRGIFLGLESSAALARRGNERIARLGLLNIRILRGDLASFDWQSRSFDYILCHDAYRHGPAPLRAAILRVIASCLAPDGVAYVGHNVLPGWRHAQVLRDVLMSRLQGDCDVATQVAPARAYLDALRRWKGPDTLHRRSVRAAATEAIAMPDDYFAHEFLKDDNEPETFTQFTAASASAGLVFLSDTDLAATQEENCGPDGPFLQAPAGESKPPIEQSIDFLTGRARRRSVLVHAARSAMITRAADRGRLEALHFVGDFRCAREAASSHAWTFVGPGGRRFTTSNAATRRGFEALAARAPASLSFADLLAACASRGALSADDRAAVGEAVWRAVLGGVIEARVAPTPAASAVATCPLASPWRRSDAASGEPTLASLRHEPIVLDGAMRALLPWLDGTRDHAALADILIASPAHDEARLSGDDEAASRTRTDRVRPLDQVARALERLRVGALLSPSAPGVAAARPDGGTISRLA